MRKASTNIALFIRQTEYNINELKDNTYTISIGDYPVNATLFIDNKEVAESLLSTFEEIVNAYQLTELGG
jgi:hypothetical protein